MKRLFRALMPALVLCLAAQITLAAAGIVYLVRTGTDSEGNAMFRQADSRDTYLAGLFDLSQSSQPMQEVARYYDQIQKDKLAASLQGRGLSAADQQYAMANAPTQPVYIEVNNSTAGAYNDWKGRFSIQGANGQVSTITSPRVVFALGSDVARSGNRGLIEQTLVHEIGHGGMCQCVLCQNLPNSPYLSKPHSGGSTTDPQLAFIEGWAEFVGTYFTGRKTIAEDPGNTLDTNWYAKNSNGTMKSAQELLSTEGWNATVLYHISTLAKDQNAMWKMTQVMSRTTPQSTWELLQRTAQYFPELAPAINQVVNQDSGGQIPGVTAAGGQYVAGAQASGTYAGGTANSGYANTGSAAAQYQAAMSGNAYSQYAGYNAYANQQAQGGSATIGSMGADTRQLEQMYIAKKAELDAVPWWKFWEKSSLKSQLSQIEDVYARQTDMTTAYQGAGQAAAPSTYVPVQQAAQGGVAPGSAAAPRTSYNSVMDAMKSNDSAAMEQTMDAYRKATAARAAAAARGPNGER